MRLSACPPLLARVVLRAANENPNDCRGQSYHNLWVGEGCSRHQWSVQAQARRYKPIVRLLRIRPSFYSDQLPTANPHPTLPLQARGGMTQALEIGTNSPNLLRHCEVVPHGRLIAAPTVASPPNNSLSNYGRTGQIPVASKK